MKNDEELWDFRRMEAELAKAYGVATDKRTTFASRLKNFHRLHFPAGFVSSQGRTAKYRAGEVAMMALALEMTNMGLPPERTVKLLDFSLFAVMRAVDCAARELLREIAAEDESQREDTSTFLIFDPLALGPLMTEEVGSKAKDGYDLIPRYFLFAKADILRDTFVSFTSFSSSRMCLINVTSMLARLAWNDQRAGPASVSKRKTFYENVAAYTSVVNDKIKGELYAEEDQYLKLFFEYFAPAGLALSDEEVREFLDLLNKMTSIDPDLIDKVWVEWRAMMKELEDVDQKA